MIWFGILYLAAFFCGISNGRTGFYSFQKFRSKEAKHMVTAKYTINGREVSADEFNAAKQGNSFGGSTWGGSSSTSSTKKTFFVNGKRVTEEEFNRLKNGLSTSGIPYDKYHTTNSVSKGEKPSSNHVSRENLIYGKKPSKYPESNFVDFPPKYPESNFANFPSTYPESNFVNVPPKVDKKPPKGGKTPHGNIKLTDRAKKACIDTHNKFRQQLALGRVPKQPRATQMLRLEWDEELSKVAGKWASKCVFKHSNTDDYCGINNHESVGENLGTGTMFVSEELTSEEQVIDKLVTHITNWFNEHEDYNYNTLKCNPGKKCGHYTQVVSDKSETVGCAIAMCKDGVKLFTGQRAYLVACNYGPAGNFLGEAPYESKKPNCPKTHPIREDGFCVGKGKEDIVCEDTSVGCQKWKREGKCAMCHNPYYKSVSTQCPKTCGKC
ncbi:hypothetical protein M514_09923 [Trichuris suis]|uniref:ShKT domain-containing protein n=2 Tax=Trichuris suis TaxID=68888 RepID=A0A085LW55_9BILA|nr:hypothetical protein M513_09923 [Trichuris suis]KFD64323.1 hypothetical protein M514_09923 [Trichuris suis]